VESEHFPQGWSVIRQRLQRIDLPRPRPTAALPQHATRSPRVPVPGGLPAVSPKFRGMPAVGTKWRGVGTFPAGVESGFALRIRLAFGDAVRSHAIRAAEATAANLCSSSTLLTPWRQGQNRRQTGARLSLPKSRVRSPVINMRQRQRALLGSQGFFRQVHFRCQSVLDTAPDILVPECPFLNDR